MKLFISYTSSDRTWAHWIAWTLKHAGYEVFVHEWEVGAGENIPRWMEERLGQADKLIGVFSDAYCKALYSQSERWAAYWQDPGGREGFLVPIKVADVAKWPVFIEPLKRLSLVGLSESDASSRLSAFLERPSAPLEKPLYPGADRTPATTSFGEGGDPIRAAPDFPATAVEVAGRTEKITASSFARTSETIRCIDEQVPKPVIFGRDDEIETIVGALLTGKTVLVAGGPGMGKTAVATAALYDPRVVPRFGRRRVFVSLETATEPRAILAKLVEALGLPPTGDDATLLRIVEASAAEQPFAAILDNAETVFDFDRAEAERLLNLAAPIDGLSLVMTIRGVPPSIPNAVHIDDLSKLDAEPARDAFLAVAGVAFSADPDVPGLLGALDGHALSIRLIAGQAIGLPTLKGLRESWDEARAEILRRPGEEETRLTSVRASLALSLNSRRMNATPLARRLLSLLALLPAGLAESEVQTLLGDRGTVPTAKANDAIACLHQLRLVERRLDGRLRMLTPLRECLRSDMPPLGVDRKRLFDRYLRLAAKADTIGSRSWEIFREKVEAEADNLDSVCEYAVTSGSAHKSLQSALLGLADFHQTSGRGTIRSVDLRFSGFA